ncbi:MAG: PTS transporter subunit EIIA [Alphaproteobacteria bacterium]|nr:PTS transporter subunit EIIA [Alphaproteobacteria bacterium]
MELSEILKPSAVKSIGQSVSKKRLLQELSALAAELYDIDENTAFDALQERESLGPTGVGEGIAIPHARIEGLKSVVAVFFRLEKPMEYDSVDRIPVDLIFTLFAPMDSGVDHLKALAVVSRLLRQPSVRAKLRANDDPSVLYTILTEVNASKAA